MDKAMIFIDTEFNGVNGKLISMALVGTDKHDSLIHEFYEVIELPEGIVIDPWVKENVMPALNKSPIKYQEFQDKLCNFLRRFSDGLVIVADWPSDIKHFCEALITAPGEMFDIPRFEIKVEMVGSVSSLSNALKDAKALRKDLLERHNYRLY